MRLQVFDIRGRWVKTITDGTRAPGRYALRWDGTRNDGTAVDRGFYFYQLRAGEFEATRRLIWL